MSYTEGTWASTGCTDQITVTFTATDECGLTTSQPFTFTITDTTPPALCRRGQRTAECTGSDPSLNAAYIAWRNSFGGVTATDICGAATMSYTEGTWASTGCTDQITVTFTATDECGLTTSTTHSPSPLPIPLRRHYAGGANGTAECTGSDPSLNAAYIAWRNSFGGVTATDICGAATMSYTEGTWSSTGCTDHDHRHLHRHRRMRADHVNNPFTFTITDTTPPALCRWGQRNGRMHRI